MNLVIRKLTESDVEPLAAIEARSFSMPWSAKDFSDLLKRDYCLYLVAEVDGRVVGCLGMTDICHEGNIDNVVVDEDWRGKGIAWQMMQEIFVRGARRGVEAYTLEVRISNQPAIRLYEKAGFVSEGIRPNFYEKPTEDAVIMWKRLQTDENV